MLTRESFRNVPAPVREEVEVPSLGGSVFVRQMTAGERDEIELSVSRGRRGRRSFRARTIAAVVVDADGQPVFDKADVEWLADVPVCHLEPIFDASQRLNGMTARDRADLEKN